MAKAKVKHDAPHEPKAPAVLAVMLRSRRRKVAVAA